jgi:hypothetical protein
VATTEGVRRQLDGGVMQPLASVNHTCQQAEQPFNVTPVD